MTDEKKEPPLVPIDWVAHVERDLQWMCRDACKPDERARYAERIRDMVARAAKQLQNGPRLTE